MAFPYRKGVMSPDDDRALRALVASTPSSTKLVALLESQRKKAQARGGFFQKAANVIEVVVQSMAFAQDQIVLLDKVVACYGMEAVVSFIEYEGELRDIVQGQLHQAIGPNEGAEKYRGQYSAAISSLGAFGIDTGGVPTWEEISARITPEKLALIGRLKGARLILVPPKSRQDLVRALNCKVGAHGIKSESYTHELKNDQLWNNGKREKLAWEVFFVDARQDIPYNEELQAAKTACEQMKALLALHEQNGVGTLVGARAYLSLVMLGLFAKTPIDERYWTVLNADVVVKNEKVRLSTGCWYNDQVRLGRANSYGRGNLLRLRGAVRV